MAEPNVTQKRSSSRAAPLPAPARALVAGMMVAGAAGLAVRIPELSRWMQPDLVAFLGLATAIAVAEAFPLPLYHRTEVVYFSLTDAVWVAGLVLVRPGVLTFAVAVGVLAGQAVRGRAPIKIAFNVGQFVASITLAEVVYRALGGSTLGQAAALSAAAGAMAVAFAVYATGTALIVALVERKKLSAVLLPPLGLDLLHWAGNVGMGLVGILLWQFAPGALPLLVLPLFVAHFAYRAWLEPFQGAVPVTASR